VHHAHIKCNEAVSGFLCGIPLADIAFGTLKVPEVVFLDGAPVIKEDLDIPRPHFALLRWLDSKVEPSIIEYRLRVIKGQAE
jgi:hypothetical protein